MATPAFRLEPRHWVYLDDQRTHEVHAQVRPLSAEILLHMTEMPAGSRDPAEALVDERRLPTMEQLQRAMLDLEERLAVSGTYYRADVADMRWSPVQAPAGARRVDLRAHEVAMPGAKQPGAKLAFHHFHSGTEGRDALLITVPRQDLGAARSILAELDFDFPAVDAGELKVIHPRLAPGTLRSSLVRQHVELPTRGYAKLVEPRDYERAYGSGWLDRVRETFRRATQRVLSFGQQSMFEPAPPPVATREHAPLDPARLETALGTDKVRRLRARFLQPADVEQLFLGGELAIRRFVTGRRRRADHTMQYDLAVLESSLLVEYGLRKREQALLDEEGAKLLRYAHGSL